MSKIEWTGVTWNPIGGCSIVSPGCTNCYAMKQAARLEVMNPALAHYRGLTRKVNGRSVWTGKVALAPDATLLKPLQRQSPTTFFVNSMSDLFHEDVPDEWIDRIFAVMALSPQHTFQVLTKRADRMRDYMESRWTVAPAPGYPRADKVSWRVRNECLKLDSARWDQQRGSWPLPNVWLGVSAEDQRRADERIPDLLATPAAVRFVSAEPLLGPIDFSGPLYHDAVGVSMRGYLRNKTEADDYHFHSPKLDWIIVGGESGPDARPMHPDWARSIRDQCTAAGVPFFFKQWGNHEPIGPVLSTSEPRGHVVAHGHRFHRSSKAKAGRLLDGREWSELPRSLHRVPTAGDLVL